MESQLDQLVSAVLSSPKYRHVCPELVRHVGRRELSARRDVRRAVKATRNKLHQVAGAYLETRVDYARALEELRRAKASGEGEELRRVCRKWMARHASTRERIAILDRFYATALAGAGPIRTVLDVACGLNPLAIPWMGLEEPVTYYAYDVYLDMAGFLQDFLSLIGVQGQAEARDVIQSPPRQAADLALILKTIPCLEQLDKQAGARLLEALNADLVLVSFPVHSLGGRAKGMVAHYEAHLRELVRDRPWPVRRFEFASELAFLIAKGGASGGHGG